MTRFHLHHPHLPHRGPSCACGASDPGGGLVLDHLNGDATAAHLQAIAQTAKDRFGPRVEPYMKSFAKRPGGEPLRRFARYFIDGKAGRPKDWDEFMKGWSKFVDEGTAMDAGPWKKEWSRLDATARNEAREEQRAERWRGELATTLDSEILDRSNWTRIRGRPDDPAFGERHAYTAGLWFQALGMKAEARDAFA